MQTTSIDCGPAVAAALLRGYGVPADVDVLREACRTDVDGTSIEAIQALISGAGVPVAQLVVPSEHLWAMSERLLPAVAVVVTADELTHFVVIWRPVGRWFEVMDPGTGRRWVHRDRLREELLQFPLGAGADAITGYLQGADVVDPTCVRLRALGLSGAEVEQLAAGHLGGDAGLVEGAALLNAVAVAERCRREHRLGRRATRAVLDAALREPDLVALSDRTVVVGDNRDGATAELRGAVIVTTKGRTDIEPATGDGHPDADDHPGTHDDGDGGVGRPVSDVRALLDAAGVSRGWIAVVGVLAVLVGVGATLLAAALRPVIEDGDPAGLGVATAVGAVTLVAASAMAWAALGVGRRLEVRVRHLFAERIARLADRYTSTRPASDTVERVQALRVLRNTPIEVAFVVAGLAQAAASFVGVIVVAPAAAVPFGALLCLAVVSPLVLRAPLAERTLRSRTMGGALMTFTHDSWSAAMPIRSIGGQGSIRSRHDDLLGRWRAAVRAEADLVGVIAVFRGVVAAVLIAASVERSWSSGDDASTVLLVLFWSLLAVEAASRLGVFVRIWPVTRSVWGRANEPLRQELLPETPPLSPAASPPLVAARGGAVAPVGVAIVLDGVVCVAGGQTVLAVENVEMPAGAHVAVIGPSGAGKSTLVGAILGWVEVAAGHIVVDGAELDEAQRVALRQVTAWADPDTALWDATVEVNADYGARPAAGPDGRRRAAAVSGLGSVIDSWPDGWERPVGDEGRGLSGGEGQRVRLTRVAQHHAARLVVLDEAARALPASERARVVAQLRAGAPGATLVHVTHDLDAAESADMAVLIADGRARVATPADLDLLRRDAGGLAARLDRWGLLTVADGEVRS